MTWVKLKGFIKQNLANFVTCIRIALAIVLLFYHTLTLSFLIIFSISQFTDVIDGTIARLTKTQSIVGANLDAAGDILLYTSIFKIIFFNRLVIVWQMLVFCGALLVNALSALIAKIKFKKFYFAHTILLKIMGASIFALPFVLYFASAEVSFRYVIYLCTLSYFAGIESCVIGLRANKPSSDVLSIIQLEWQMRKNRRIEATAEGDNADEREAG